MLRIALMALAITAVTGCGDGRAPEMADSLATGPDTTTVAATGSATMRDAAGAELGVLTISADGGAIAIAGSLRGITSGPHGIHIHAVGRCEAPFESAGDHWNPASRKHGLENQEGPHRGDLLNLDAGADGTATVSLRTPDGTLAELMDADGASVVIHAAADDQRTDPSGGSGDRIACGVVETRD